MNSNLNQYYFCITFIADLYSMLAVVFVEDYSVCDRVCEILHCLAIEQPYVLVLLVLHTAGSSINVDLPSLLTSQVHTAIQSGELSTQRGLYICTYTHTCTHHSSAHTTPVHTHTGEREEITTALYKATALLIVTEGKSFNIVYRCIVYSQAQPSLLYSHLLQVWVCTYAHTHTCTNKYMIHAP